MKPRRWIVPAVVVVTLTATALAYRQPEVMIQLGEQLWACFG